MVILVDRMKEEQTADTLQNTKRTKAGRGSLLSLVYLAFTIAVMVGIGFLDKGLSTLPQALSSLSWPWLVGAMVCMVGYLAFDARSVYLLIWRLTGQRRWADCLRAVMIGKYYNNLTPAASGGQPFQIHFMYRAGIPVAASTCSTIVKFVAYQSALFVYCVMAFITQSATLLEHSGLIFWAAMLGCITNFAGPLALYIVSARKDIAFRLVAFLINLGKKLRLVRQPEQLLEKLEAQVEEFQSGLLLMRTDRTLMVRLLINSLLEMGCYLAIPYLIYRGMGLRGAGFWAMLLMQAYLYLATSYFPTPGASGASEGGFSLLFTLFFPSHMVYAAMLLWRVITYYLTLLLGGGVILADSVRQIRQTRRIKHPSGPPR